MPNVFAFFSKSGSDGDLAAAAGLTSAGAGAGFLPLGGCLGLGGEG